MRLRRTLWWFLALWAGAFWGCSDSTAGGSDAIDMRVDQAQVDAQSRDQAPPDQSLLDQTVDAGVGNLPEPVDPHTCLPPAARLFGAVVTLDYTTLRVGVDAVALSDTLIPIGVAVAPTADRIVLVREGLNACQIEGRDPNGRLDWQVDVPGSCRPVGIGESRVWAPVDVEGGALWVLDVETGAIERRIALPAPPTTAPGFGGLDESGGSHWYVGAGRQLVRITPSADWAVSLLDLNVQARALAVADARWAVVVGALDDAPGLGAHAQRIALDSMQVRVPLELPGPAYAAPVALPPCPKVRASGGSHWWCGDGMFATAGEGWLAAWTLLDQRPRINVNPGDGVRITGLTVGRDGLVYSGGSHWIDGGWRVQAHGLDSAALLIDGAGLACLSAPLLDTDGQLFTHHLGDTVRGQTRSGGHPTGWARPYGDTGNQAHPVTPGCLGGISTVFTRLHVATEPIIPVIARVVDGDLMIAGAQGPDDALRTWVGRVAPDGVLHWDLTVPERPDVNPATDAPLSIAPRRDQLELVQGDARFLRISGITPDGVFRGTAGINDDGRDLVPRASTSGPPGVVLTGVALGRPGQQWILNWVNDVLDGPRFVEHEGLFAPQAIATLAPGWVTLGETEDGQAIEAVDGDAVVRWRVPLIEMGFELKGVDVEVSGAGTVYALFSESGPEGDAAVLVTLDGDGTILGRARLADARPVALALRPDGAGMLLLSDLRIAPVTATGAIGSPRALPWTGVGIEILAHDDGMFVVGHDRQGGLILARTTIDGYASCGDADRCVTPVDCPPDNACALPVCEPSTGACGMAVLEDGMPCGPEMSCGAGVCGP